MEPLVSVHQPGRPKIIYSNITPKQADRFAEAMLKGEEKPGRMLCKIEEEEFIVEDSIKRLSTNGRRKRLQKIPLYQNLPFFKVQQKIVLRNCGFIDATDIEEYIGRGGYASLLKTLTAKNPDKVIEEIKVSGLRGRGGAGFPTGIKWELCKKEKSEYKYIICNADEGDPGAYMDRSILEGDPHAVLEGMIIGAYAMGAGEGIIYIRTEYPLTIERLKKAIVQAKAYGLIGDNILNKGFSFNVRMVEGAGAFVCGEETSLIASIEARAAEPRPRPPFPVQTGLWGFPTNINNVETWANVPVIIARTGGWYAKIGTEKSKGTKVFSLVGAIKHSGLVEVPMGTKLNEIVYDIGGGILKDKKLKAIQTGGPSGGCIPASMIDMPVDYEKLAETGSIMGSGGMVVMDQDNCMVDIARYFTTFTRDESCGKCTSCRDGLDAALQILNRMTQGTATEEDLTLLDELSQTIKDASACGLGQTAPNPILSTMQYFREEYTRHIKEKKCPAGVCKPLFKYKIDRDKCTGCLLCKKDCPAECIEGEKERVHTIVQEKCTKCGNCYEVCNEEAVIIV
jgi:NADH:ubiquinone oxidoreductase subunit F (NADH-binding)/(2Fe-2S) ferredoxin